MHDSATCSSKKLNYLLAHWSEARATVARWVKWIMVKAGTDPGCTTHNTRSVANSLQELVVEKISIELQLPFSK